ncbi:MAG TPA: methyl-accepting chemotaxis protein [Capsulimonadaceae bacterium]|jgi:methyl-accepting chemotaxis protein
MNWFLNLRVAHKLALAFGVCLFLAFVAGAVAVSRMAAMIGNTHLIVSDALEGSTSIGKIVSDIKQYRVYQLKFIIAQSPAAMDAVEVSMKKVSDSLDKNMRDYEISMTQDDDKANFAKLKSDWAAYRALDSKIEAISRSNNIKACDAIINGESSTLILTAEATADKMAEWNSDRGAKLAAEANTAYNNARSIVISLIAIAILIGTILATSVTKSITSALTVVDEKMASFQDGLTGLASNCVAVGEGDFIARPIHTTEFINWDRGDEFGRVSKTFDAMLGQGKVAVSGLTKAQASLSSLIGHSLAATSSISTAASEIASGNEDLSSRTTEQASSLEETAASMEEMTSIVKQNAENARNANKLAAEARAVAEQGGAIVNNAVASMQNINSSSKQISDIISVIDEIAFQTNLLALNAAVEAARVGEQGRGFAVVASEVRNLAGRSSTAAKEIKALVQNSVREVTDGTTLVNKSGEQLKEIVASVNRVADIVANITAASQEQSAGIEQVNKAVIQMDEITQQNAALVEEATAASQAMAHQAMDLQQQMRRFKIDQSDISQLQPAPQPRIISVDRKNGTYAAAPKRGTKPALSIESSEHRDNMEEF